MKLSRSRKIRKDLGAVPDSRPIRDIMTTECTRDPGFSLPIQITKRIIKKFE